jgi:hypothetical protein
MKIYLSVFLILISVAVYSQDEKHCIKISPFSAADDFSFPTIMGGFETRLSQRLSWYSEIGIKYRKGYFEKADTSFINPYGFKAKTEIRYYFPKSYGVEEIRTILNGLYVGANIFYIMESRNSQITFHPGGDTSIIRSDGFVVNKSVIGLNLIAGLQKKLSRHFLIDLYAGIGYRFRIVHDSHLEYDPAKDILIKPAGLTVQGYRNDIDVNSGVSSTPGASMGLRIGYRF